MTDILSLSSAEALPVIPLTTQESLPYKLQYEDAVRSVELSDKLGSAALAVVRLSVEHRREMAVEERDRMLTDPALMEEYAKLFAGLDAKDTTTAEDRVQAFATARYLPSYELFARLVLKDETSALSTELAMKAFELLRAATQHAAIVVNDQPEAHIKVDSLIPESHPYSFAITSTKVDGVAVEMNNHLLQVKTRRQGLVDMNKIEAEETRDAFKIVARTHAIHGVTQEQLRPFRAKVRQYLASSDNYLPVIDRAYMTRTDLSEFADVFQPESHQ